jgi:UV DNA damage endonuclease|tara:strand:+ start:994 stop:1950 length:957 start_codon:yes stop_codon:yes gene_type:complete
MKIGYACINMTLSDVPKSKRVTTNRSMIKKTFQAKGLKYASELSLQNVKDLFKILIWNEKKNIKFYRMSSDIFPWMSEYEIKDLPDYLEISKTLKNVGDYATKNNHRLTFHPGPFNVLGSPKESVVEKTIKELNSHSQIFDMMGFFPSHYNKINIHVGGTYGGDFEGTASRWVKNFYRLDENTRSRLTLENDDKASMWSVKHLYDLIYQRVGVPIVFDYHHHRFCTGGLTEESALSLAASTWQKEIPPVVHVSESRAEEKNDLKIRPQAHSDFIRRPINSYGQQHDIMLECKKKELALLEYRSICEQHSRIATRVSAG